VAAEFKMWEETYQLDLGTILTLMAAGFMFGFMMGKKFLQFKMMLFMIILFVGGSYLFLNQGQ
jgi:hypothetical protein